MVAIINFIFTQCLIGPQIGQTFEGSTQKKTTKITIKQTWHSGPGASLIPITPRVIFQLTGRQVFELHH